MTHTLHRRGTPENLAQDYVILVMESKEVDDPDVLQKLQQFIEIALRHNPVNFGDCATGNQYTVGAEGIRNGVNDASVLHAVYEDPETVAEVVQEVKEADLGLSVVVSGLYGPVSECCQKIGQEPAPHTIEYSLGIWGRKEKLPDESILQIATMCGHGMVSFKLISDAVEDVKEGRLTPEQAAQRLAEPCVCGIFNPSRAAQLLKAMAAAEQSQRQRRAL